MLLLSKSRRLCLHRGQRQFPWAKWVNGRNGSVDSFSGTIKVYSLAFHTPRCNCTPVHRSLPTIVDTRLGKVGIPYCSCKGCCSGFNVLPFISRSIRDRRDNHLPRRQHQLKDVPFKSDNTDLYRTRRIPTCVCPDNEAPFNPIASLPTPTSTLR